MERRCHALQRAALLLIAAGVAASTSCDDPAVPSTPASSARVAVLRGYVRIDAEPVAIAIGAREYRTGRVVAQTRSNASGWYQLALPTGTYTIDLDPSDRSSSRGLATVRGGRGVRHLDVHRATLKIQVLLPIVFDGEWFACDLDPEPWFYTRIRARAHKGRLEFETPPIPPGAYRIRLDPSYGPSVWLPGTTERDEADVVTVGTASVTPYRATVTHYAVITGTIRGSCQEMDAPSPRISAHTPHGDYLADAYATLDGAFTLKFIDAQPVRLSVSIIDIERWIGGDTFEEATTFHPREGQRLDNVSFVEGGIYCRLEGPADIPYYRASAVLHDRSGHTYETNY